MSSINKIFDKIIEKLVDRVSNANDIHLNKEGYIHENSILTSANINGNVIIKEGCKIINGVRILGRAPVTVGRYTSINGPGTEIHARLNKVEIGSFCSIARNVTIQEFNHRYNRLSSYFIFQNIFGESIEKDIDSKGEIVVGNDVWVGANSSILSGVKIGDGAIVAANSVVTKDVPSYAIVGGSPAKQIKMRFTPEVIKKLLTVKWWDWNLEKLKRNQHLFEGPLTLDKLDNII